ncbi:MAG: outer membrane protein assembly factor BamD [Geminicoccaceae bacterium]
MLAIRKIFGRSSTVAFVLLLAACAGESSENADYVERPVNDLYNTALDELKNGNNTRAAAAFQEVERQHPYSQWATRGQLMAAYAFYEATEYDKAIDAARRFIDLHPGHKDVPYAHYLVGVSYYDQISDVGRDQKMTELAHQAFDELVRRFPDSTYARDARLKGELAQDHLAGREMAVGRYYQRKGRYVGAANRFRTVVEQYQTTTHIEEALHRLTEVYLALGVRDEAVKSAAVLGHNYPSSEWYQDSYALLADDQTLPPPAPASDGSRKTPSPGGDAGDDTLIEPPADAQDGPA